MMNQVLAALGAAMAGVVIYANLPTRLTIPFQRLNLKALATTSLRRFDDENTFPEAAELSSYKEQINAANFQLFAVVHQKFGVDGFRPSFKGEIYLDVEKQFFGPQQRWMSVWHGFLRPSVWLAAWRAKKAGFTGNMDGEGRILGGVYVIGPGDTGVLFEHHEGEFGDHVDYAALMQAIKSAQK